MPVRPRHSHAYRLVLAIALASTVGAFAVGAAAAPATAADPLPTTSPARGFDPATSAVDPRTATSGAASGKASKGKPKRHGGLPVAAMQPVAGSSWKGASVPKSAGSSVSAPTAAPWYPSGPRKQFNLREVPGQPGSAPGDALAPKASVLSASEVKAAGLSGLVVRVDSVGNGASVSVPAAALASVYGADYAGRVRWLSVSVPAAGQHADLASASAVDAAVDRSTNGETLTARPSESAILLAATVGSTASATGTGDYGVTPIKPSSAWQVSAQTGDFSWSYPLRVPPAAAGPTPDLALAYSSSVIDGETSSTNNQAGPIGNGWDISGTGSISRSYMPCAIDTPTGAAQAATSPSDTGDQCWRTDNATLSFGGRSGTLVKGADGSWRLANDDGSKVEHLTGAGANGTYDDDYWRITTTDGTQYYFGLNRLPGWSAASQNTNSVFTEPVYGNDAGEPCHAATFAASSCNQGWQWNLDYVVDPHGNSEAFYYAQETDNYTANSGPNTSSSNPTTVRSYVRGGYLARVDYGMRAGYELTQSAPERVVFDHSQRCLAGAAACANHANWFDTPWDQDCASGPCATKTAPTFFSENLATAIHTQLLTAGSYSDVDLWTLHQSFPSPGDGTSPSLWLSGISHQGSVGGTATVPDVSFTGAQLGNRILTTSSGANLTALIKWRISAITTEAGATIMVSYLSPDCTSANVSATQPQSNTSRCYPTWWTPPSSNGYSSPAQLDWFARYPVSSVISNPNTGGAGQPADQMYYDYQGAAAWRYDTSPLTPDGKRTWNVFAGYSKVRVRHGDPSTPATQQSTTYTYFQGLNGDRANTSGGTKSVSLTASDGTSVPDSLWWAGRVLEAVTTNGVGGATLTDVITKPWAKQTGNDGVNVSELTNTAWTKTLTAISTGTRTGMTTNTIESMYGRVVAVDDNPDTANAALERCTLTAYADNATTRMLSSVDDVQTLSGACGAKTAPVNPPPATGVVSEIRTSFDGGAFAAAPTKGDATNVQTLKSVTGPAWIATSSAYDAIGRVTSVTTPLHPAATTAYTPAATTTGDTGPLTRTVAANDMGWKTTTTYSPAWGAQTSTTDPNSNVTTAAYDPLGRRVKVWTPSHPYASNATSPSVTYAYTVSQTSPTAVATTTLMADGQTQTTYALFDGLLRARQTQTPSEGGGSIDTDTYYDAAGNVGTTNGSYYAAPNPSTALFVPGQPQNLPTQDRFVYDGAGRKLSDTLWVSGTQKWVTVTAYPGADRTDSTPPAGGTATTTYTDARGETTKLLQYHAPTPTGAADTTTYAYAAAGQLASMTDTAGDVWSWTYDLLGRQTKAVDPDTGTTTSSYDDASRLVTTTDARNQSLTYTYDNADRKTGEYLGTSSVGTASVTWTYDTLKLGQLTSAARNTGGGAYVSAATGYDAAYHATGSSVTIPASQGPLAGTYVTSASYDMNGNPTTLSEVTRNGQGVGGLPAETQSYGYDDFGLLGGYDNGTDYYVFESDYDHLNELTALWGASNTEVETGFYYEPGTNRLDDVGFGWMGSYTANVVSHAIYAFDAAGDVTSTKTLANNQTDLQCFSYDYVGELTQAWTPASNSCAGSSPSGALGGPAPYGQSYSYDAIGDRKSAVRYPAVSGGATTTDSYSYPVPGASAVAPHAVSSVTRSSSAAGSSASTASYAYDVSGNAKSRPGQAVTFDAEGRLASVATAAGTTSDTYDAAGNLLVQSGPSGSMLFLGDTELHVAAGSSVVSGVRTYSADGHAVAEHTTAVSGGLVSAAVLTWLSPNAQNTETAALDDVSDQVSLRWFDPFGNPRGAQPAWTDSHGFLNAPTSAATGLTHLGARDYDPATGKFLSVDPVFSPTNPLQDNGYSYALNNPVTAADPSGLEPRLPGQCVAYDATCLKKAPTGTTCDSDPCGPGTSASVSHNSKLGGGIAGCQTDNQCQHAQASLPKSQSSTSRLTFPTTRQGIMDWYNNACDGGAQCVHDHAAAGCAVVVGDSSLCNGTVVTEDIVNMIYVHLYGQNNGGQVAWAAYLGALSTLTGGIAVAAAVVGLEPVAVVSEAVSVTTSIAATVLDCDESRGAQCGVDVVATGLGATGLGVARLAGGGAAVADAAASVARVAGDGAGAKSVPELLDMVFGVNATALGLVGTLNATLGGD